MTTSPTDGWTASSAWKEAFGVTKLGDLIDSASRANSGRSMQAAADLATRRGAPISKSHISKNSREIETITPQLIRGIAEGYDIPEEDVARAALEDLGFVIPDHQVSPESAIRRDPTLSSEARAMLLAAIGAARVGVGSGPISRGVRNGLENPPQPSAPAKGKAQEVSHDPKTGRVTGKVLPAAAAERARKRRTK